MTALVTVNLALLSDAPDGVDQLRSLIVELAVSGRLVPQQPDDEPSADLAVRLTASKTQAMADNARRAKALERPETPVWPFKIPESWTWQVLDDLLWITGGVTLGRKLVGRALVALPYLRVANVQRGFLSLDDLKDIEVPEDEVDKYLLQPADLLITEGGDWDKVGRTAIWRGEVERCLHQNHVFRARPCSDEFLPRWAELYLNSAEARAYFAGSSKQTTNLASINMSQLRACAFPLPPLAEQHRIVAKVDELMALCDRLEALQQDAEAAHARLVQALLDSLTQARDVDEFQACWRRLAGQFEISFATVEAVDKLKQVIRDVAVSGRLLAGSAGEALWEWSTLGAEVTGMDSGWSPACLDAPSPSEEAWGVLRTTAVQSLQYVQAENKALPSHLEPRPEAEVRVGDILFTRAGPMNRVAISCLVEAARPRLMLSDKIIRFRPKARVVGSFMALCLNAGRTAEYLEQAKSGMAASQVNISQAKLKAAPIPVPPLDEQSRIVATVTELLALCDQLKARIAAARAKHAQLAEALVAQAVAI